MARGGPRSMNAANMMHKRAGVECYYTYTGCSLPRESVRGRGHNATFRVTNVWLLPPNEGLPPCHF
eukprot:2197026-Pyramimonas_sp.AAC.4